MAAGMWMRPPEQLQQIRTRIADRPADWRKASADLDPDEGGLKRPPRGLDPDLPMIEDIKRKRATRPRSASPTARWCATT